MIPPLPPIHPSIHPIPDPPPSPPPHPQERRQNHFPGKLRPEEKTLPDQPLSVDNLKGRLAVFAAVDVTGTNVGKDFIVDEDDCDSVFRVFEVGAFAPGSGAFVRCPWRMLPRK